jgi:CheY-like chemotaxis protein
MCGDLGRGNRRRIDPSPLRKNEYQVTTVDDDETGSKILDGEVSFDFIMLNHHLPDLGGITQPQRIKVYADLRHIPVVVKIVLDGLNSICERLAVSTSYYLTKPNQPSLQNTVVEVLCMARFAQRSVPKINGRRKILYSFANSID